MRHGLLLTATLVAGTLGALSFATYWIAYRTIAILPFDRFVLPTGGLPSVLFTVASPRRSSIGDARSWVVLSGFALAAFR